jgi:hypothetical protein
MNRLSQNFAEQRSARKRKKITNAKKWKIKLDADYDEYLMMAEFVQKSEYKSHIAFSVQCRIMDSFLNVVKAASDEGLVGQSAAAILKHASFVMREEIRRSGHDEEYQMFRNKRSLGL